MAIDLKQKLSETTQAIEALKTMGMAVPDEAAEIMEILERAIAAEDRLATLMPTPLDESEAVEVIVNGRKRTFPRRLVGYKDVLEAAGFPPELKAISVTYRNRGGNGILHAGETIVLGNDAILCAADTAGRGLSTKGMVRREPADGR